MKAKILCIGLFIMGFIAACGVNDSEKTQKKFNPQVDGTWEVRSVVSIPCDDGHGEICKQYTDITYVSIDYPHIYACYKRYNENENGSTTTPKKEHLEITHASDSLYSIITDNGDSVRSDSVAIKMEKYEDGDLSVLKKTSDGEWHGYIYSYTGSNENGLPAKECSKNAIYSKETLYL